MITSANHIKQDDFVNLTDYSAVCPKGKRTFFTFVHFLDYSTAHWSNIFALNRKDAMTQVLAKFSDCIEHIREIALYEKDVD
ncbi:MAG: hypothetical protein IKL83_07745 [Muribaculaceae bacterium]|nr:hypothetical protein [Muribaculaceae bacterium]